MLARILDQCWLRNGVALIISLLVDIGLIAALISLGKVELRHASEPGPSIATFDLASVSDQPQGASVATVATASVAPQSKLNATVSPLTPKEWSVTTLPPVPTPTPAPPQPQAASAVPAQGVGTNGSGSGAGYDPYAFASYRRPDPTRMAGGATATPQPLPDALARLTAALAVAEAGGSQAIGVRAYIDAAGRIIRAELLSSTAPNFAQQLARIAPGFQLCAPDPARPSGASLVVTLTV
jgi:hypothetical protein